MARHEAMAISRRTFLVGGAAAVGGLLLPKIPGTAGSFLVPFVPQAAWADEAGGATGTIMVVNRTQIGIAVGDMGTYDPEKKTIRALGGATVTIHSFYNDKEVTGTTDDAGKVVFDIDGLAEQNPRDVAEATDSNGKQLAYCFYGSIAVTRDGYRDVLIPFTRIRSLSTLVAPTRAFKEGEPYLRQLSFDRWDIQYTKAEFISSSLNADDHTFAAEVWVPAKKKVTLRLHCHAKDEQGNMTSAEIGSATFDGSSKGAFQSASFAGPYLCVGRDELLPAGCKVYATLECDGAATTVTSGLAVTASPFVGNDGGEIETEGEITIAPNKLVSAAGDVATQSYVDEEDKLNIATIPSNGLPKPFAGSSFTIWKPTFEHIMFDFSPLGFFLFGVKIGSLNLSYEKDETTGTYSWKREPKQTAKEQFKKLRDEQNEQMSKVRDMYKPDPTSGKSKKFSAACTREIKVTGGFQMYAQLAYDWDEEKWSGDFNAVLGAAVSVSWTIQVVIVFIPIYVTFELGGQVSAGLKYAMTSKGGWSPSDIIGLAEYDPGSSGPSVELAISIGVTLGVGVAGVLCAYIRGAGYITFKVMYLANSKTGNPRFRLGIGAEATVGVQILLFSWSGKLWSKDWPGLYDSEPDEEDKAEVEALASGGGLPLDSNGIPQITAEALANDMVIVGNDALMGTAEFAANAGRVALFANEEPAFVEPVDLGGGNLLWDVPPMNGASDDGIALLADEGPDDHFIYLGESNTGAQLPNANDPKPGEVGIADVSDGFFGGIKPSVDKLVFKNVFSDPRTKVIYSTMFRIATVNYDGEARTRVVYTSLGDTSWDNPHVIEFDPVFSAGADRAERADMYDYEFSVASLEDSTGTYLYLMIISGNRPDGDKTSFAVASSKTVVNVVRLRCLDENWSDWRCDYAAAFAPATTGKFVAFSCPNVVTYADDPSIGYRSCAIGACLVRQANTADKLFGVGAARWLVSFYLKHQRDEFQIVTQTSKLSWSGSNKLTMGPIVFDPDCQMHIGIVNGNGAFLQKLRVLYPASSAPQIELSSVSRMADHLDVQRLYPTGKDCEFYAIRTDGSLFAESASAGDDTSYRRDARLYLLRFGDDYSFEYLPVTPTGSCVPSELTISKDGRYLFYMVNKEGKSSRGFDENGNVGPEKTAEEEKADNSYRVMAMARVGNLFTQPFALAVLDHPLDYVASMVSKGATASLIGAEIVDPQNSIANIYDIRVPLAAVGTPLSVATEGSFAFAGEDTVFDVTVRNDGNTILAGGKFSLYKVTTNADGSETVDANPVATTDVNFQPSAVVLNEGEEAPAISTYDLGALPDDFTASPLASAADEGLILPGQTVTYKVTFPIPADWASGGASEGSTSSACKVRVDLSVPHYLDYEGTTMALLLDNADGAGDGDAAASDNSNADFDDMSEEEWKEFIWFLIFMLMLFDADPDDWPQTELSVFDSGLELENIDDLFNAESASGSSGEPGSGSGSNGSNGNAGGGGSNGGSNGGGSSGKGSGSSAGSIPETGDGNFIGKLLFGHGK